jgi:hypothetical protein
MAGQAVRAVVRQSEPARCRAAGIQRKGAREKQKLGKQKIEIS